VSYNTAHICSKCVAFIVPDVNVLNSKVKLSPTIALQVAKGEMMYSSSFLTSALDGVDW
jgi:hypothetical protein